MKEAFSDSADICGTQEDDQFYVFPKLPTGVLTWPNTTIGMLRPSISETPL